MVKRRTFLKGMSASGLATIGLPPLQAMFNSHGTAYADETGKETPVESRFVTWFNGNGVPERFWIPQETGDAYATTPCLAPLGVYRNEVQIITGLDNAAAKIGGGNGHTNSMSGLVSCAGYTGRGAGAASFDQVLAGKLGVRSRFRSLQIGVANESFGESMQRNMSWAGMNRPLAPEMLPRRLFDRLFGQRELDWLERQKSVLDVVRADAKRFSEQLGSSDRRRVDEHLSSVRDLERAISSLPAQDASTPAAPSDDGDMRDYPRIAKVQSDLLVSALTTGQTRVASYMLTKCQSLTRFPWLGHTLLRHHDYTHYKHVPGGSVPAVWGLRDICRWHVEEFAYLIGRLRSVPEGDGTVLDNTLLLFVHEHAEGNDHKNTGLSVLLAGNKKRNRTGTHTRALGTIGDLYLTIANDILGVGLPGYATASRRLTEILRT